MDPRAYAIHKRLMEKTGHRFKPPGSEPHQRPKRTTVPLIRPPENCEDRKRHGFAYDPLPTPTSVRLLQVHPVRLRTEFDAYKPLRCTLIVRDLNDAPVYDALSYTWGCPVTMYSDAKEVSSDAAWAAPAFDITCNGKPFSVTANLYAALLSLRVRPSREASRHSYIWIDQICIDQLNLKERNAQVTLMRRIYKQAQKCSVWLGGDDRFSETGLETMARLWNMTPEMTSKFAKARIFEAETYDSIGMEPIGPWEWIAYYAFLGRSWFWRSWVVQEAALSRDLSFCCGVSTFSLDIIGHGFQILNSTDWATPSLLLASTLGGESHGFSKEAEQIKMQAPGICLYRPNTEDRPNPSILEHLSRIRGGTLGLSTPNHRALSQILFMFQELRASDPRDKVYSLLALAEESGQVGTLVPDYRKSVAGVFQDTMQFLIQSSNSLNDLSKKEDPRETKTANLPSWVPDFTINRSASPRTFSGLSPWSAGERLGKTHIMFHPGAVLEVRGLCIGRVREVHDPSTPFNLGISVGQRSLLKVVQALPEYSMIWVPPMTPALRSFLKSNGSVPNKDIYHRPLIEEEGTVACQSRFEVLWRTLIVDCFAREFPPSNSMGYQFLESWISSVKMRMGIAGFYSGTDSLTPQRQSILNREGASCSTWDALRSSISDMYRAQTFLLGQESDAIQDELFPEQMAAILPELDSAWAEGRASAMGEAMAEDITRSVMEEHETKSVEWEQRVTVVSLGKCIIATNKGQLGLCPESTLEGDEVWTLAGADTPFVLRPRQDERYTLIGEAYVHGAMFARPDSDFAAKDIKTVLIV